MNRLFYSPEAINDLDGIWTYIVEELKSPIAARNTIYEILDTIEKLKGFSEIGPSISVIIEIESDYRFLVCGNYLAFYRITEFGVNVDRILYGG